MPPDTAKPLHTVKPDPEWDKSGRWYVCTEDCPACAADKEALARRLEPTKGASQ